MNSAGTGYEPVLIDEQRWDREQTRLEEHEARIEAAADEREKEGEFMQVALERMHKDYGLYDELLTHCSAELCRLVTWEPFAVNVDTRNHPYFSLEGQQTESDDQSAISAQVNGWLKEQEQIAKREWIEEQRNLI